MGSGKPLKADIPDTSDGKPDTLPRGIGSRNPLPAVIPDTSDTSDTFKERELRKGGSCRSGFVSFFSVREDFAEKLSKVSEVPGMPHITALSGSSDLGYLGQGIGNGNFEILAPFSGESLAFPTP
jgi:hypothetical protein